jgi:PAS domain S-box-containing protein
VLLAMLLGSIYFTWLELRWVPFLAGILVASILALVGRASRAEWTIRRRTAQLASAREKLANEIILRALAEGALGLVKNNVHYLDQEMPAMLAYVDAMQRYRYHNRAFRAFMGVRSEKIDGRNLREVLGAATYSEIEDSAKQALSGRTVRFERTQRAAGNTVFRYRRNSFRILATGGKCSASSRCKPTLRHQRTLLSQLPL